MASFWHDIFENIGYIYTSIFLFFLFKQISLNSPDLFTSHVVARVCNVKYSQLLVSCFVRICLGYKWWPEENNFGHVFEKIFTIYCFHWSKQVQKLLYLFRSQILVRRVKISGKACFQIFQIIVIHANKKETFLCHRKINFQMKTINLKELNLLSPWELYF